MRAENRVPHIYIMYILLYSRSASLSEYRCHCALIVRLLLGLAAAAEVVDNQCTRAVRNVIHINIYTYKTREFLIEDRCNARRPLCIPAAEVRVRKEEENTGEILHVSNLNR